MEILQEDIFYYYYIIYLIHGSIARFKGINLAV